MATTIKEVEASLAEVKASLTELKASAAWLKQVLSIAATITLVAGGTVSYTYFVSIPAAIKKALATTAFEEALSQAKVDATQIEGLKGTATTNANQIEAALKKANEYSDEFKTSANTLQQESILQHDGHYFIYVRCTDRVAKQPVRFAGFEQMQINLHKGHATESAEFTFPSDVVASWWTFSGDEPKGGLLNDIIVKNHPNGDRKKCSVSVTLDPMAVADTARRIQLHVILRNPRAANDEQGH